MGRAALKPFRLPSQTTASIHQNVSRGYIQITPSGERQFVPYTTEEFGSIHSFISPQRRQYKHMKWTKTKDWKDRKKAKKASFRKVKFRRM